MVTNLIVKIPSVKKLDILETYCYGFIASITSITVIYVNCIRIFPIYFKTLLNNFYTNKFPDVLIKSEFGDVKGQLYNFQNKEMIMLNENGVLKAVPWNQIRIIEIKNKEEPPSE